MTPVTVYVLRLDVEYEYGEPCGVYSTEAKAMAAADVVSPPRPKRPWKKDSLSGFWERVDARHVAGTFTVEPFVLDEPVDGEGA